MWAKDKSTVWDIAIEGKLDGKSFIQVLFVAAPTKAAAVDLALARFRTLEGEFVEVAEVKRAKGFALQAGEVEVAGRIFFGEK